MTLDPSTLKEGLRPLFDPSGMPRGPVPDAVFTWITAYCGYAQSASAGGTVPATLVPLRGPIGTFADSLDSALRVMWGAVAWTGPGLIGKTLLVPPLQGFLSPVSARLIGSRDPSLALSLITDALHTYTLSITVAVVTPSGVTVTVPLA